MSSGRVAVLAASLAVLAACTSAVHGRGRASGTASTVGSSLASSPAISPAAVPSSAIAPPSDIVRTPVQTAIGDPVTADLCTAIGLDPFRGLGTGLTPSFDARQFPPGCSITISRGTTQIVGISVYADVGEPASATGRTTRVESGLTVYVFPFDSTTGSCPRDIKADGVLLDVDAYTLGSATPEQSLSCAGSDAMADRLAAVAAGGGVPRLPLASPSLSALDSCSVVRKANLTALPAFAGSKIRARGFGVNCELKPSDLFLFINFALANAAQPNASSAVTVDGHPLYETDSRADFCAYVSTQATTADGRYEQVSATSTVIGSGQPQAQLCEQTAQALARYLTAAGLR